METYLTIEELAEHLKLAAQTIRRYVLNREIPFHKIKKVVRFRLSEIEKWIDNGGGVYPDCGKDEKEGDLFAVMENETGETATESGGAGTSGADVEAGEPTKNEGTQT